MVTGCGGGGKSLRRETLTRKKDLLRNGSQLRGGGRRFDWVEAGKGTVVGSVADVPNGEDKSSSD